MFDLRRVTGLFFVTAVAEIAGCYLPWLVLTQSRPVWRRLPTAASLAAFAWLLTLHPSAVGRTYAAYGGVYVVVALLWLWRGDVVVRMRGHLVGRANRLADLAIMAPQPRAAS